MANDKENKGLFKKILKFFGICTLGATIALSGLVMTACSSNNPIDPPSDDGYHEVIDGDQIQDEIPGDDDYIVVPGPGTGDVIEDPSQGGGENNPPAQEEQPGEEIEDPGQGGGGGQQQEEPGENQEEQEEIDYASLLYYEDEDGITHYNTEKMADAYSKYCSNTNLYGSTSLSSYLYGTKSIGAENIIGSNYNSTDKKLEVLIQVDTNSGEKSLHLANINLDISSMSENSIEALEAYFNNLPASTVAATRKAALCTFEKTFVAGEDEICDAITNVALGQNGEYVVAMKCKEVESGASHNLGDCEQITTYYVVNENGNVVLKKYMTFASRQMGDSWQDNVLNNTNVAVDHEEDVTIFENFTIQSQKTAAAGFEIII